MMWCNRITGAPILNMSAVVPTVFSVIIFFVCYVVFGGPFPCATLLLGAPCFVCSWWCLWTYMIAPGGEEEDEDEEGAGVAGSDHRPHCYTQCPRFTALWPALLCSTELFFLSQEWLPQDRPSG
jgi:hypothetical protein